MENKNTPINPAPYTNNDGTIQYDVYLGLTKREYFAGLVLQGIMSNQSLMNMSLLPNGRLIDTVAAEYATRMADLLLEQLEKQP